MFWLPSGIFWTSGCAARFSLTSLPFHLLKTPIMTPLIYPHAGYEDWDLKNPTGQHQYNVHYQQFHQGPFHRLACLCPQKDLYTLAQRKKVVSHSRLSITSLPWTECVFCNCLHSSPFHSRYAFPENKWPRIISRSPEPDYCSVCSLWRVRECWLSLQNAFQWKSNHTAGYLVHVAQRQAHWLVTFPADFLGSESSQCFLPSLLLSFLLCYLILWYKMNFYPCDCAMVAKVTVELKLTSSFLPSWLFYSVHRISHSVPHPAFWNLSEF